MDFEGDVEEVFCRTFVGEYESFGETIQVDFIEGGSQIIVTKDNRQGKWIKLVLSSADVILLTIVNLTRIR